MKCKCVELSKMEKIPYQGMYDYAKSHLELESKDDLAWRSIWSCPVTGIRFLRESVPGYKNRITVPKWTVLEGSDESVDNPR